MTKSNNLDAKRFMLGSRSEKRARARGKSEREIGETNLRNLIRPRVSPKSSRGFRSARNMQGGAGRSDRGKSRTDRRERRVLNRRDNANSPRKTDFRQLGTTDGPFLRRAETSGCRPPARRFLVRDASYMKSGVNKFSKIVVKNCKNMMKNVLRSGQVKI
jgi:hypothetical protein